MNYLKKYAKLLVGYSLSVQPGERVYIASTSLAEDLVREVYAEVLKAGGIPYVSLSFREQGRLLNQYGEAPQLQAIDPIYAQAMQEFECYLYIRAPFYGQLCYSPNGDKQKLRALAHAPYRKLYSERTADLRLKRSLCEYPTMAHAQNAGLSLDEYTDFIYTACRLDAADPKAAWEALSRNQQSIVDHLNACSQIHYKGEGIDIQFSTAGRKWINSDGKTNMPSGEVYTAPVEDSVEGQIHFAYPSIFQGQEVEGITLWVKAGEIQGWEAKKGQKLLDQIFEIPGARRFGEAAIGTNRDIQRPVKNILFDEKIGGTVHMAVGQTYMQCGGKNQSAIHWDMIAEMKNGGEIWADGEKIYDSGQFLLG